MQADLTKFLFQYGALLDRKIENLFITTKKKKEKIKTRSAETQKYMSLTGFWKVGQVKYTFGSSMYIAYNQFQKKEALEQIVSNWYTIIYE